MRTCEIRSDRLIKTLLLSPVHILTLKSLAIVESERGHKEMDTKLPKIDSNCQENRKNNWPLSSFFVSGIIAHEYVIFLKSKWTKIYHF